MTHHPTTLLVLALALCPAIAAAQRPNPADGPVGKSVALRPMRAIGWGGGSLALALPRGEFADYVHLGGGLNGFLAFKLSPQGTLSLRLDGTFLIYGSETRRVPLSSTVNLVTVDVTTSNMIASMGIGPQLAATSGWIRPYVNGSVGFSYFWTSSSVRGADNIDAFASSTNFGDAAFALRGGGGLWIQLTHGRTPLWLDLAAHYVRNGRVQYLRPGSIDASVSPPLIHPIESETDFWLVQLGVSTSLQVPRR
jgi:hypothetical protein